MAVRGVWTLKLDAGRWKVEEEIRSWIVEKTVYYLLGVKLEG